MYIKIKKYKDYPDRAYLQVVESYREEGKVRNRTVLNLGRFDNGDAVEQVNQLMRVLLPYSTESTSLDIELDIIPQDSKQYGPLLVFQKLWKEIGLEKILKNSFDSIDTFYDIERAIFNMVLNRLTNSVSKRGMNQFQDSVYGMTKFELHHYYRAMDYLIAHQDEIEKNIFDSLSKGKKNEVGFFDTTTIVFFGEDKEEQSELLNYGFSKARRSDLKQIVVGVLMSQDGIPLGHETFAGNQNDVTCFKIMIEKMVTKYGIKKIVLVGDRGMVSAKNIKLLEEMGLDYILGYRMRTIPKADREEVFNKVDLIKLRNSNLQYKEVDYKSHRLIFCYNADRAVLDAKHREKILEKLQDKIKSGKIESIIENKDYKRFLDIEGKAPKLSEKKIKKDELFDGVFVLTSNTYLQAPQIVEGYKGLWQVEQGFRQLKGELELGPLYHYTDERIRAHVMICFLALIIRRKLAAKLKKISKNLSYSRCMNDLKRLSVVEMKVKDEEVHLLTEVKEGAKKMFKAVNLELPKRIIYRSNPVQEFVVPTSLEIQQ